MHATTDTSAERPRDYWPRANRPRRAQATSGHAQLVVCPGLRRSVQSVAEIVAGLVEFDVAYSKDVDHDLAGPRRAGTTSPPTTMGGWPISA